MAVMMRRIIVINIFLSYNYMFISFYSSLKAMMMMGIIVISISAYSKQASPRGAWRAASSRHTNEIADR